MRVLSYAAKNNHLKLYKWAKKHDCPFAKYVYSNDVEYSNPVELKAAEDIVYDHHHIVVKPIWKNTILRHANFKRILRPY